jgi:hypothetical protein
VRGSIASQSKTHLCGAAQPGPQFVQLHVWELEVAERVLVQGLSVRARAREKGS